ncbi:hypothetical protein R1Y80_09740 [Streptomyces sp. JL1001]|uniref:Uncharacterized protein n=1 Tax=Streptomyces sp. JL1001 TaxID=3078227 RepID=A0AAU8KDZ1_9ACTN
MTDTTPTPADRPADQLRAAAECASAPELAVLLNRLADASDHHGPGEGGVVATLVHPALAVAQRLLGTTEGAGVDAVLEPQGHPDVDLFAALQHAGFDVDEANARMYAYARMVLRQEKAIAAPPAPADRAVLREAADIAESLREFTPAYGPRKSAQISENVGVLRVADHLRALAADAAAGVQPPTSEAHHTVDGTRYLCHTDDHYCPTPPAAPAAPEEPTPVAWSSVGSLFCTTCCDGHPDYRAAQVMSLPKGGTCDECGARISATPARTRAPEEPTR